LNSLLHNEKGVALVLTVGIVAILITAALQLGKFTSKSVSAAMVEKDLLYAEQTAMAGIAAAKLMLVEDAAKNTIDSVQEHWSDPEAVSQLINQLGIDAEKLAIEITDELSKIQINALIKNHPGNELNPDQHKIWENLFRHHFSADNAADDRDTSMIINSVKDWLDSLDDDLISGVSGAESDYYLGLDPPYECANKPLYHIDELLNIRGISADLLYVENRSQEGFTVDEIQLQDLFTIYGADSDQSDGQKIQFTGRININTAGTNILAALLPEGMEGLAQDLADYRVEKSDIDDVFIYPLDKGWYKQVIDLSEEEQKRFERMITYSTDLFKVKSNARQKNVKVTLVAYLKREKNKETGKWICRTIQLERE
jgi:general secretion pathway protein K